LKQITLFEEGILPEPRSSPEVLIKTLSEKQKYWLELHNKTNWSAIGLNQEYKKQSKKGKIKGYTFWKLPATEEPLEHCQDWVYKGCLNHKHQDHKGKTFVKKFQRGCFRASCSHCWLRKWLARESNRAARRIENFMRVKKSHGFREPKPIHVIVSPPWNEKFISFDVLKKRCREMLKEAGIIGGLLIYHPFDYKKDKQQWQIRPHFHVVGFGWVVNTVKISKNDGWVIKNKKTRDSIHSTVYYQLSHAGVSNTGIHSVSWFGDLGYRAKYASEIKVEDDKEELNSCPFCKLALVFLRFVGLDRPPPPDFEFEALLNHKDWVECASPWVKNPRGDFGFHDREGIGSVALPSMLPPTPLPPTLQPLPKNHLNGIKNIGFRKWRKKNVFLYQKKM